MLGRQSGEPRLGLSATRARRVLAVAGLLQGASTRREVQDAYLGAIPGTVRAAGHGFYVLDPTDLHPVDVKATVPDQFLQRYEDEGRHDDPVLAGAIISGKPVDSSWLPPGLCWVRSAVFSVLSEAGYSHSLEAPVHVDGTIQGTLNMARTSDDQPFSAGDLQTMAAIADQVGAALTRAERYERMTKDTVLLADALDAVAQPIIITTVEGELIFRNRTATRQVPGSSATYIERAEPVLRQAIDGLARGERRMVTIQEVAQGAAAETFPTPRTPGSQPTASQPPGSGVLAAKVVRLPSHANAVVSFLSFRPTGAPALPEGTVPLSRREHEIANLVSQGMTTRQIAELSFVSENTVKQHLKRIFAKLQVSSRAGLVQAVWQSSIVGTDDGEPTSDP